jgi:pSer/pThr/pTyr-binding forkhead associated (FHA) protein/S1-C subfamily serine protease
MPYLKLRDLATHRVIETRDAVVRLGRDSTSAVAWSDDAARVVSARHAEIRHAAGEWRLVDLGSRNGTYVNGRRVTAETPLKAGDEVRLGETGPTLQVVAVTETFEATLAERPAVALGGPPERPVETRPYAVTLVAAATGKRFEALGTRIRMGRGPECEVQAVEASNPVVSRVHAELTVGPTGGLAVRDAGSKNGTFLNGDRITQPMPVRLGDRIMLGPGGPVLLVDGLGTAPMRAVARPKAGGLGPRTVMGLISKALGEAKAERARGGRASTRFLKAVAAELGRGSARKLRWLTTAAALVVLLLSGGVYGVYWLLSEEVARTGRALRTAEDSARAEAERLRRELALARAAAAPAAQVESLRVALFTAQGRTAELQATLERAQAALGSQLAAGETRRLEAQRELQRLHEQLAAAERRAPSQAMIDSLRRAVSAAEAQTAGLATKLRAIRGLDFASIAQQHQGAVGLITAAMGGAYYDGTGFVISPDGYMLTNWHVVADSTHPLADTIWVTMADQAGARLADVVGASRDRDLALLKIRLYQGLHLTAVDWSGTKARQGEPAALIGFPAGSGFARDRSRAVRTSMTAGILSRVTSELIQFDGMTAGGSSGSPVFNANGEVVSVHRAGLRQGPGFALSVPVRDAIALLPPELKSRLGLQ